MSASDPKVDERSCVNALYANARPRLHSSLWRPHETRITIAIMRKRTVKLHGRHCDISVHREGKHVWIAVGDYLGKEIRGRKRGRCGQTLARNSINDGDN
jgi:hypothetical protein